MMGNRGALHVQNGLSVNKYKHLSIVGAEMNIYLSFETYWPEMIFVLLMHSMILYICIVKIIKHMPRDATIATVRKFQAAVATCFEETLSRSKICPIY